MVRIAVAAALAACTTLAFAQDRRPDYGTAVNAAQAKKIAAGVIGECQKNSWNVAVAVVDNHGFLVYFERMDNTQTASMDIAVGKAKAAATYRRPTRAFADVINKGGPATATLPGVFASPGRPADHGRRQGDRRRRRQRRHRRPGRAVRQGWR
jgi:glc operon protein GlcG